MTHYGAEFWKKVPPNEPYRVVLGEVRDRLYQTRERSRHLLAQGHSDIPEEATFTNVEDVCPFCTLHFRSNSWINCKGNFVFLKFLYVDYFEFPPILTLQQCSLVLTEKDILHPYKSCIK